MCLPHGTVHFTDGNVGTVPVLPVELIPYADSDVDTVPDLSATRSSGAFARSRVLSSDAIRPSASEPYRRIPQAADALLLRAWADSYRRRLAER